MKKILLSVALICCTTLLIGQTKYGIKAGVNFANQEFESEGVSVSGSSLTSFHFLGYVDRAITQSFSIQPGIGISGKGVKFDVEGMDLNMHLLYLDIPVNAVAKFPLGNFGKFIIGAGPYAGIGISGKISSSESDESETDVFGEDGYKRGDFGLNFLGGFELNQGLTLNANYGLGLANIGQDTGDGSVKNKVFSISLGFLF